MDSILSWKQIRQQIVDIQIRQEDSIYLDMIPHIVVFHRVAIDVHALVATAPRKLALTLGSKRKDARMVVQRRT